MKKRLILISFVILLAFPLVYGLVATDPEFELCLPNPATLVFAGGFAKVTGVFTGMKGKLGSTVLQGWKGIQVLRTHVIPANPRTGRQTTNRTLFTNLIEMFKPVVSQFVHVFWNPFVSAKETGWANLIGLNQGLQQGTAIDYTLVQISKGSLPLDAISGCLLDPVTDVLHVDWVNSFSAGSSNTDFSLIAAFNTVKKKWYFSDGVHARDQEATSVQLPVGSTAADFVAYLLFFTGDYAYPDILSCSDSDAIQVV